MADIKSVPVAEIPSTFGTNYIDLISAGLQTRVLSTSNEFFCPATNLQTPTPPIHKPNTFTEAGAWYDGWETRRHNPAPFDWVVFRLGVRSARIAGAEIDTGFFSGNQAPAIGVQAVNLPSDGTEASDVVADARAADEAFEGWTTVIPAVECGPACRQAWQLPNLTEQAFTHVRLQMFPDGGIGRFRLFGAVADGLAGLPKDKLVDLAAVVHGGLATRCSDQHFGGKDNLLLPGRGVDMGDGWETARSRAPGHVDWVVVRLAAPGNVERVVVDTAHFKGNFPREVQVFGATGEDEPVGAVDARWVEMVKPSKCQAHFEHEISGEMLAGVQGRAVRWVKMVIIPDGGVKRLRVFGTRADV